MNEAFKVTPSENNDDFFDLQLEKCLLIEENSIYQINDNLGHLENEILALTQNESKNIQQYLIEEARGKEIPRKCPLHSLECPECVILQKINSENEERIVNQMLKNQFKVTDEDGKVRIRQLVTYKFDKNSLFNPSH